MIRSFEHPPTSAERRVEVPLTARFAEQEHPSHELAVEAYVAAVRSLLDQGYVELLSLSMRRPADGATARVAFPRPAEIAVADESRREARALLEAAVAAFNEEVARLRSEGFVIAIPEAHEEEAPGAPFQEREDRGPEGHPSRRYFVHADDPANEAGPELHFRPDGIFSQQNFQVRSRAEGTVFRMGKEAWEVASYLDGVREGFAYVLHEDGSVCEIQRRAAGRLTALHAFDAAGKLKLLTLDGDDEHRERRGRWDSFDDENHIVNTYAAGKAMRIEFRRLVDDSMEQVLDEHDAGQSVTYFDDDGIAVTIHGDRNDAGERIGTWSYFDAFGRKKKLVTYDAPGTQTSVWTPDGTVLRPTTRFERSSAEFVDTVNNELFISDAAKRRIQSLADAKTRWRSKTPCRAFDVIAGEADVTDAVLSHPTFQTIEALSVSDTHGTWGQGGFAAAIRAGKLDHLRSLRLAYVRDRDVLAAIGEGLPRLESLVLTAVELDDDNLATVLRLPGLGALRRLEIQIMKASTATARALAEGALPSLTSLHLYSVAFGDHALRALARGDATRRLECFTYTQSACGDYLAPEIPLTVRATPALDELLAMESLSSYSIGLDLVEIETPRAMSDSASLAEILEGEPSLGAFREVWRFVTATPALLDSVVDAIASWPRETRIAPPFAITELAHGRCPAATLRLARGLRIFDLAIDERTGAPASDVHARVEALTQWLGGLHDEADGIEVLDLSPDAWLTKFSPTLGDIERVFFSMTRAAYEALFASFRNVKVLNLSQSDRDYPIKQDDSTYRPAYGFPQMEDKLNVVGLLATSPMSAGLEELYLQGYSMAPMRWEDLPLLPNLRVLDLSGHTHRKAATSLAPKVPRLRTLILGGDPVVSYAIEGGDAASLDADIWWEEQAELEALVVSAGDVKEIAKALPKLEQLLLGGEVRRGVVRARAQGKSRLTVRDAKGADDRCTLPW